MTINSPAAVILAMYVAQAELAGVPRARLGGTLQNDILKEYQAQKEFVFPPRPSMRLVRDTIGFTAAEMPRWHSISISGYHIREAGSTAAQELAFTLANGFAYVELALQAGSGGGRVRPAAARSSSTRTSTSSRRSPSTGRRGGSGPGGCATATARPSERSMQLRFHTQTAGVSLTAQQPEVNIVRTAIEALAGVLGGHPEPAHELDGRGVGAAVRAGGAHRAAHPAGASPTRPTSPTSPTRSAARSSSRRSPTRWNARPRRSSLTSTTLGDGSMLEGAIRGIEENWFQGEHRRVGVRAGAQVQRRPAHHRRRQPVHRRQRRGARRPARDHQRRRGTSDQTPRPRSSTPATRPPSLQHSPDSPPAQPNPTST